MKSAGISYPSGATSAPTICGNCYGPGTNPPDAVSGGAIGWQFGYWRTWYENDGGSPNNFPDSSGYGSMQQYIWTFSSGQVKGYKGASASPWVNQSWSTLWCSKLHFWYRKCKKTCWYLWLGCRWSLFGYASVHRSIE